MSTSENKRKQRERAKELRLTPNLDCENCGRPDSEKPMTFKGLPYCSDDCGKSLGLIT